MTQTLPSQLAADILQRISTLALPLGTRLSERSLADALRVSRSPVRTALRQLADQALLEGKLEAAAKFLRRHLTDAAREKHAHIGQPVSD